MAESNFVDYVKIYCRSGKGGRGSTHMRREKYIPNGGPDGGDEEVISSCAVTVTTGHCCICVMNAMRWQDTENPVPKTVVSVRMGKTK